MVDVLCWTVFINNTKGFNHVYKCNKRVLITNVGWMILHYCDSRKHPGWPRVKVNSKVGSWHTYIPTICLQTSAQTMMVHWTASPSQCPCQVSTFWTLLFQRYSLDNNSLVKVPKARSKLKSGSHHDVALLYPQPWSLPQKRFFSSYPGRQHEWKQYLQSTFIGYMWGKNENRFPALFRILLTQIQVKIVLSHFFKIVCTFFPSPVAFWKMSPAEICILLTMSKILVNFIMHLFVINLL